MTKDEALKMAIELLESPHITEQRINEVVQACKDALEQPAQESILIGIDFAQNQWKESMVKFLKEKQICAFDNNKIIMQSWIDELENK